jgi:hypothetical protein
LSRSRQAPIVLIRSRREYCPRPMMPGKRRTIRPAGQSGTETIPRRSRHNNLR